MNQVATEVDQNSIRDVLILATVHERVNIWSIVTQELARSFNLFSFRLELAVLLLSNCDLITHAALQLLDGDSSLPQHEQINLALIRGANLEDSGLNTERAVTSIKNSYLALRILREVIINVLSL